MKNNFLKKGYKIIDLFSDKEYENLVIKICKKINSLQNKVYITNKNLSKFHNIEFDDKEYANIINSETRNILINENHLTKLILQTEIYDILKQFWGHSRTKIVWVGSAKKGQIINSRIGFRIARPVKLKSKDAASEHIDLYNTDKKSFVTIWIPIIGFSKKYSLKIYPESHLKDHNANDFEKNHKYISRVFKKKYVKKFKPYRPNLKRGQALIIDPNIIHGGASNQGIQTRVSLEIRLFNKDNCDINTTFDKKLVN